MSFQVTLTNQLSGNVNLKMCDPGNLGDCSDSIGHGGSDSFPAPPGRLNQLMVSPTDPNLAMPSIWKIEFPANSINIYFHQKDSNVIINGPVLNGVLSLSGGKSSWELIIEPKLLKKQPTNVTIGDN
jgi:hypothetical protein